MTVGAESPTEARAPTVTEPHVPCANCGTPLAEDQDWCLSCGLARARVRGAGSWVIPVAVVGTVTLLVAAAFAIALINLSSESNRNAATLATTAASATPAAPTPTSGAQTQLKPFAGWPHGATGWTVALASSPKRTTAKALAAPIRDAGVTLGILHSSRFKAMKPGSWVVFSGQYPTQSAAQAQAAALAAQGHPGTVELVAHATTQ
jgi:hypothetical protein